MVKWIESDNSFSVFYCALVFRPRFGILTTLFKVMSANVAYLLVETTHKFKVSS